MRACWQIYLVVDLDMEAEDIKNEGKKQMKRGIEG